MSEPTRVSPELRRAIDEIKIEADIRRIRASQLSMEWRQLGGIVVMQLYAGDELELGLMYSRRHSGRIEESRLLRAAVLDPDVALVRVVEDSFHNDNWLGKEFNLGCRTGGEIHSGMLMVGENVVIDQTGHNFAGGTKHFESLPAVYGLLIANNLQIFPISPTS